MNEILFCICLFKESDIMTTIKDDTVAPVTPADPTLPAAPVPPSIATPPGSVTTVNSNINGYLKTLARRLLTGLVALIILIVFTLIYIASSKEGGAPTIVFLCGVMGGIVGIQKRLKTLTEKDLELMVNSWIYTYLAPLVGGVLSLVLYMLFVSDLLSGELFPKFVAVLDGNGQNVQGFQGLFFQQGENFQAYAKLVVWSFVAGYSEKFVTDVVGRFEGAAVNAAPGGS